MELTQELIDHIEDLEGFSEEAYKDVNGVLTIGFGHTNATKTFEFDVNTKISRDRAEAILIADLKAASKIVRQMLKNKNLTVNQTAFDYMVLVYFNRPWVLRKTMEDIATLNADIAKQSQIDEYEKVKGPAPDWYINRIDKEFAYLNEFDDKTVDGTGPIQPPPPPPPPDDANQLWQEILNNLEMGSALEVDPQTGFPKEEPSMYQNIFGKVRNLFKTSIDKQLDFMDEVYDR